MLLILQFLGQHFIPIIAEPLGFTLTKARHSLLNSQTKSLSDLLKLNQEVVGSMVPFFITVNDQLRYVSSTVLYV